MDANLKNSIKNSWKLKMDNLYLMYYVGHKTKKINVTLKNKFYEENYCTKAPFSGIRNFSVIGYGDSTENS